MKAAIALVIVTTACTTTGRIIDHDTGPHAHVEFGSRTGDEAAATFPALLSEAALPTADRIVPAITGEKLSATVNLCVAPDGSVDDVAIERSSGLASFDDAVRRDVTAWKYEPFRAPREIRTCKQLVLSYQPR